MIFNNWIQLISAKTCSINKNGYNINKYWVLTMCSATNYQSDAETIVRYETNKFSKFW